ncbi:hypothetical protein SAMN05877838_1685 [Hoeflea halophila]|uniref:Uncharacterized protein n=1 Tax=Hoeflea halophila TaxID=714899 RepID=A0A286I9K0_9HYPH|nr:hypothetical protein SAMN05877838_1685 [Hoeflea halophila]
MQNSLSEMEAWVINRGWTWVANPKIESKGGAAIITDTEGAQYRLSYRKYSDMISVQCSHGTLDQFVADGNLQIPDCSNVVEAVEKIVPTGTLITTVSSEKMIGKNFHFEQGSKRFDADVVVQREWFEGIPLPAIIHTNMIHLLDAH